MAFTTSSSTHIEKFISYCMEIKFLIKQKTSLTLVIDPYRVHTLLYYLGGTLLFDTNFSGNNSLVKMSTIGFW